MSVAGSRWAHRILIEEPRPNRGGLSHRARAVLLALAADANAVTGLAFTSAPTISHLTGHSERNVRHAFDELEAWHLPRQARPGTSDVWCFPPGPIALSTQPRSQATGVTYPQPRSPATATPVAGDRRRVRREVGISTRRVVIPRARRRAS